MPLQDDFTKYNIKLLKTKAFGQDHKPYDAYYINEGGSQGIG